jgi:peptidyl-prolyl cis-trans isomerase SurA
MRNQGGDFILSSRARKAVRSSGLREIMTRLSLCWVILVAGWAVFAPRESGGAEAAVVDRIVAVVNEDIITLYDIENMLRPLAQNIKSQGFSPEREHQAFARLRSEMLDNLINAKLTEQEVKRYNISVNEEEIDTYIRQIQQKQSITVEGLQAMLAQQGMSMEEYRKEVKAQLQRTRLVNREVRSRVIITQAEIKDYYEKNKAKYGGGTRFHLWNLFVKLPPNATAADQQSAQDLLNEARGELQKGRSFQDLVRVTAAGTQGIQGSDLGLYRIEELTPQLRDVVKDLKADQYSGIVESEFGYQIVYVETIHTIPAMPMEQVESEIQDILFRQYVDSRFTTWLSDLRKRSHIRIVEAP